MVIGWVLAALLLATGADQAQAPAPAQAEAKDGDLDFVVSMSLKPGSCPPEKTRRVALDRLLANPARFVGKCVRVSGLAAIHTLYPDIESFYRQKGPILRSGDFDAPIRRLGFYGGDGVFDQVPKQLAPVEVVGTVGRCENGSFMGGYCHYVGRGPYIILAGVETRPGPLPVRRVSAADRAAFGDLDETRNSPATAAPREALEAWRAAVIKGDAQAYNVPYGGDYAPEVVDEELADPQSDTYALFRSKTSVFARLRQRPDAPFRLFRQRIEPDPDAPDEADYVGCVCLIDDCDGLWPIAKADADNDGTRPYACAETHGDADGFVVMAPYGPISLAEPVRR